MAKQREGNPRRLKILYTPTQANMLIMSKLRPMLKGCVFSKLPHDEDIRQGILRGYAPQDKTIFIWGDGTGHVDSFDYTSRARIRRKLNLDPHPDEYCSEADGSNVVGYTDRGYFDGRGNLNYANHMTFSQRDGMNIFTSSSSGGASLVGEMARMTIGIAIGRENLGFFRDARRWVEGTEGELAVTLDCDLIRGFPVLEKFLAPRAPSPQPRSSCC
ncbi:TPA: hypothetical protein EYP38_00375 [Candidatus Micrarchaeota archaeon]|nr:hypothetical protein [Candidatus Micrarchaeota archaeon]